MSITPPYTSKISSASSVEPVESSPKELVKADNIVNNYIKESSIFITSLWLNPTKSDSLFPPTFTKSTDFEKFLKEVLKRSRCSLHVLQLSMYYLYKVQRSIKDRHLNGHKNLNCPKKVFLTCLILSFKFSYDQSYKFKTWSKISGLTTKELQSLEMCLLGLLNYELNISKEDYAIWIDFLEGSLKKIELSYIKVVSKRGLEEDDLTSHAKRVKLCA